MEGDVQTVTGTDFDDVLTDMADDMSEDSGNFTTLESIASDVWQSAGNPGMQLHERAALVLSAIVVGVHGLLGLLPRFLFSPITDLPMTLLHLVVALGCAYSLCYILRSTYRRLRRRTTTEETVKSMDGSDANSSAPVESVPFVADKEDIQRWVDTVCDEMVHWASGEGKPVIGGQDDIPRVSLEAPRVPPAITAPPPSASATPLVADCQKAVSLAYELSVAVRQQANAIRGSLSFPETSAYGKMALTASDSPITRVVVRKDYFRDRSPDRQKIENTPLACLVDRKDPGGSDSFCSVDSKMGTESVSGPMGQDPIDSSADEDIPVRCAVAPDAINGSSSILSFVRRFSGSRFLYKDCSRELRECAQQRGAYLVPLTDSVSKATCTDHTHLDDPPKTCQCGAAKVTSSHNTSQSQNLPPQDTTDVMKVFSKGILSEGVVEISTTSFPSEAVRHAPSPTTNFDAGAFHLPGQEATRLLRRNSTSAALNTVDEDTFFNCDYQTRSSLNLMAAGPGAEVRPRIVVESCDEALWGPAPRKSSSLAADEQGVAQSNSDQETDHKVVFDVRKSQLSSIPEVTPTDDTVL